MHGRLPVGTQQDLEQDDLGVEEQEVGQEHLDRENRDGTEVKGSDEAIPIRAIGDERRIDAGGKPQDQ